MLNLNDQKKFTNEQTRLLQDGEILFHEGDESREMFVVVDGEIEVIKQTQNQPIVLASLKKGDFVGEMSLLESLPRSASARAKGPTKLLVIQPGGFLLKIRRDPTFAFEMLQILSRRIRKTNENLIRELNSSQPNHDKLKEMLHGYEFKEKKSA